MPPETRTLFTETVAPAPPLPADYAPERPAGFDVARIVLAKGATATAERRRFVERIAALYPGAERVELPHVPHNRVDLGEADPLAREREGKRTLVFGELKDAVRFSEEAGNTCPNYWHFSVTGGCFHGCAYCYLAGTRGVWHSPTVKVYVNLPDILARIDRAARRLARPVAFYLGKLQDGLSLDPLTAYSTVLIPFFAAHPNARQVILTKSVAVERLLPLAHRGRTILSWSLNPPEVAARFEPNVPPVEARIGAMRRAAEAGYPVRAVLMPLIPVEGWETLYAGFLRDLLARVPIARLTLGGLCSYPNARSLMERRLGRENEISRRLAGSEPAADGRARYPRELRARMYAHLARVARAVRPDIELALCLEEVPVREAVKLEARPGRCNCVL